MKLAEICTHMDQTVEATGDIGNLIESVGFDKDELHHAAYQRAVRMVMHMGGKLKDMDTSKATPITLEPEEQRLVAAFAACWLDGALAGRTQGNTDGA